MQPVITQHEYRALDQEPMAWFLYEDTNLSERYTLDYDDMWTIQWSPLEGVWLLRYNEDQWEWAFDTVTEAIAHAKVWEE
jgi:hypothetical protein